jgi:hypothetical protein
MDTKEQDKVFASWCGWMGVVLGIVCVVGGYALNMFFVVGDDPQTAEKWLNLFT